MTQDNNATTGAPSSDTTSALFVSVDSVCAPPADVGYADDRNANVVKVITPMT